MYMYHVAISSTYPPPPADRKYKPQGGVMRPGAHFGEQLETHQHRPIYHATKSEMHTQTAETHRLETELVRRQQPVRFAKPLSEQVC